MDNAAVSNLNSETEWRSVRMKKKNNKEKKKVMLCGTLLFPITIGKPAVFATEGSIYRTSNVVALHEQTEDNIHLRPGIPIITCL